MLLTIQTLICCCLSGEASLPVACISSGKEFITEVHNPDLHSGTLVEDSTIITAFGIERKGSALPYSVIQLKGEELTRVKEVNMITSLAGKVAGVQVNSVSSGLGASAKVNIRGVRSIIGDNQPLYVVDGMPILNSGSEQALSIFGGRSGAANHDGGDGISNLNSEDIESITVLKGIPATTLYGVKAANGVILITTKKGRSDGQWRVNFSTSMMFDKPVCLPEMQYKYSGHWGDEIKDKQQVDNLNDFFRNGFSSITSATVSTGNESWQHYFSYANTAGHGIIKHHHLSKHNFNLRESAYLFNNHLRLDGSVNYIWQSVKNRPAPGGYSMNPLYGLYTFPSGSRIINKRNDHGNYGLFERYNEEKGYATQHWYTGIPYNENPYWLINRIQTREERSRILASLSAHLKVSNWLSLQARASIDDISDKMSQQYGASTSPDFCGENGRYVEMDYQETLHYGDVMAVAEKQWGAFSVNAVAGVGFQDQTLDFTRYDSKLASLVIPNVFNLDNIKKNGLDYIDQAMDAYKQTKSAFGSIRIGYKEGIYLDLAARGDWSSIFVDENDKTRGYFYPSVGTSFILNRLLSLPEWVSHAKVSGSYGEGANDLPLSLSHPFLQGQMSGHMALGGEAKWADLKPARTRAFEIGTEWAFLQNRLGIGVTYFRSHTRDEIFKLQVSNSFSDSSSLFRYMNGGKVRNAGWEIVLDAVPVMKAGFSWSTSVNFASNRSKILELKENVQSFDYESDHSSYRMRMVKGGAIGDIYGYTFTRDGDGKIMYDQSGLPSTDYNAYGKLGNVNPDFLMGWSHTLSYKGFGLYLLFDCRYGGEIYSFTQADMDAYGVSKSTGDARKRGYVSLEGHRVENVKGFYLKRITENYIYDATNIRLRELSLSYRFPTHWMNATRVFKGVQLSLTGRNLFLIYKKAPFDPDRVLSSDNKLQGIDVYGIPTTRSLGFSVKCEF